MELNLLRLFQSNKESNTLGGRYKIISQLGAGGFGKTFVAEDLHLPGHPQCVVKQLQPQVSDAKSLQMARRLFDTEAQVLYKLGSHDQIPRLLAHFEDNQEFYLAQELIEGEVLSKELVKGTPWSEAKVIDLLKDILQVLAFVHQQDVIHRDIKPSNLIRRRQDGKMVLIDFGAVKQVSTQFVNPDKGHTKTISIGTQGYTPKEQLGGNPRFSSDVYAVGIIGIQALTGVHPRHLKEHPDTGEIQWRDTSTGSPLQSGSPQQNSEHRSEEINPELGKILDRMVCYDFRDRYPTAAEALEALQSLPLSQISSETTAKTRETLSSLELKSLRSSADSTLLESDQASTDIWEPSESSEQASTDIWEPSESSEQASTDIWVSTEESSSQFQAATSSSSTNSAGKPVASEPSLPSTPTVIAQPWFRQGLFFKLGTLLAVLAAVGGTFWFTKTFSSQTASQAANHDRTVAESPSPKNTSSLPEESPSSSPKSKSTVTPTTNTADSATPSAPKSEPTVTPTTNTTNTANSTTPSAPKSESTVTPTTNTTDSTTPPAPNSSTATKPEPSIPVPSAKPSTPPASGPTAAELLRQADSLRQAGNYQRALATYDQAIASKSNVPETHWGRCYSLNKLGRSTEAIAACDAALTLNPNYPEALWSKGSILEQQQQPLEALKLYDQALALRPNFADAWQNKGVALYQLGRYSEAVNAFDQAIALKPNSADAWSNRGAALWALKDVDEAIASMDKAIQLDPNNQAAINLRQQARQKLGR